ncbi:MAG: trypsin-like peptidase domain-containing protein [Clostridiales bacterium]|nr:trypsin-like peptidase domain-containing protein [Clostridiales bacterium]
MSENNEYKKLERANRRNTVLIALLAVFLAGSLIFSAIQTVYIFRLNTGRTGNMNYVAEGSTSSSDAHEVSAGTEDLPEPWFSIEEAAGVSAKDKTRLSVTDIVDLVSPATASLYIRGNVNGAERNVSAGSAFIITEDGYAVTNAHVVDSLQEYNNFSLCAVLPGSDEYIPCEVVGSDEQTDCAVVKLKSGRTYDHVKLGNSSDLRTGELVVAIGNALGTLQGTVTTGVVSALDRTLSHNGYQLKVLQTDAAINSGNSGGPLINSFGEVIGIINAKEIKDSSEGLGYAISIDEVKPVIESIINYGKVVNRPYFGVSVVTVAEGAYYGAQPGVYVYEYVKNGPGDEAGIRIGDRIISIDGVAINASSDIIDVRDAHSVGDVLTFVVERDGQQIECELTIGDSSRYDTSNTVTEETDDSDDNGTDVFGARK